MRYLLLLTVAYLTLGSSGARTETLSFGDTLSSQGKETRSENSLLHEFEYAWRDRKVILEFSQHDCRFSITEENIIPDTAARTALTMFFDCICDLETLSRDPITFRESNFPREKIQEIVMGDRMPVMLFKFDD